VDICEEGVIIAFGL